MGARLSRKKSEGGPGVEQNAAEVTATAEQKPENEAQETASEETAQSDSSPSFLETITQAVEETVNSVTEQISAPVEDVVNKGIKAVESALATVSLNVKEPAAPEQELPFQEPTSEPSVDLSASGSASIPSESTLLDDLLTSQPISEAPIPDHEVEIETVPGQTVEDVSSYENKDFLECLDKVEDLLDCELTRDSQIPNSDLSVTLGDVRQEECDAVDPVNLI